MFSKQCSDIMIDRFSVLSSHWSTNWLFFFHNDHVVSSCIYLISTRYCNQQTPLERNEADRGHLRKVQGVCACDWCQSPRLYFLLTTAHVLSRKRKCKRLIQKQSFV